MTVKQIVDAESVTVRPGNFDSNLSTHIFLENDILY